MEPAENSPGIARTAWGTLTSPQQAFERLEHAPRLMAIAAGIVVGHIWGAFSFALFYGQHVPAQSWLSLRWHYLIQAFAVAPLWILATWVGTRVASAIGRPPHEHEPSQVEWEQADRDAATAHLGRAWTFAQGVPVVLFLLVPEAVAFAVGGSTALAATARFAHPVTLMAALLLGATAVRVVHSASTGRALAASLLGGLAQAAVCIPLLR